MNNFEVQLLLNLIHYHNLPLMEFHIYYYFLFRKCFLALNPNKFLIFFQNNNYITLFYDYFLQLYNVHSTYFLYNINKVY